MKEVPEIRMWLLPYIRNTIEDPIYLRARLFREYGDIYKKTVRGVGPTCYLSHPEHLKVVLETQDKRYFTRHPLINEVFAPFLGGADSVFLSSKMEPWYRDRLVAKMSFDAGVFFEDYAETVVDFCETFRSKWEKDYLDAGRFPVQEEIDLLLINIIVNTIFTELKQLNLNEMAALIPQAVEAIKSKLRLPVEAVWKLTPARRRYVDTLNYFSKLTRGIVTTRLAQEKDLDDMLGNFLRTYEGMDREALIDLASQQVAVFLVTGYFTTVALIHWLFVNLSLNPAVERNLLDEIDGAVGRNRPGYRDLAKMPYLNAVIKETLRKDPSVQAIFRCAGEDGEIGGYFVPKGAGVVLCVANAHRHPGFWDNPEGFDPNRFIDNPQGQAHPFAYVPFGAGMRNCVAAGFATLEAKLIAIMVLQRFRLATPQHTVVRPVTTTPTTNRPNVPVMHLKRR